MLSSAGLSNFAPETGETETHLSLPGSIECDNRDHRMKPYMYGTVQLTDAATEAMLVPTSAILQQEESCYVLVCEGANRFRKAEVTTASTDGDRTVVLSGVRPGEEIDPTEVPPNFITLILYSDFSKLFSLITSLHSFYPSILARMICQNGKPHGPDVIAQAAISAE